VDGGWRVLYWLKADRWADAHAFRAEALASLCFRARMSPGVCVVDPRSAVSLCSTCLCRVETIEEHGSWPAPVSS